MSFPSLQQVLLIDTENIEKFFKIIYVSKGGNVTVEDFLQYDTVIVNSATAMRLDENYKIYFMSLPSSGILIPFIMKLMAGFNSMKL